VIEQALTLAAHLGHEVVLEQRHLEPTATRRRCSERMKMPPPARRDASTTSRLTLGRSTVAVDSRAMASKARRTSSVVCTPHDGRRADADDRDHSDAGAVVVGDLPSRRWGRHACSSARTRSATPSPAT
jgi:hypothetical protein